MKFSIITVVYNGENTIERAIKSVIEQKNVEIEYIIVDGVSTDHTMDIVTRYRDDISRIISEPDDGIYDAMNKGSRLATGDIIAFLNSDDWYETDVLQYIMEAFQNKHMDVLLADTRVIDKSESYIKSAELSERTIYKQMPTSHQAIFSTMDWYRKIGEFNTKYLVAADFEWVTRSIIQKCRIETFHMTVVNYSMSGFSTKYVDICYKEAKKIAFQYYTGTPLEESMKRWYEYEDFMRSDDEGEEVFSWQKEIMLNIPDKKNIYLFGKGIAGRKCYRLLKQLGYTISGFVDNFIVDGQNEYMGKRVQSPEKLQAGMDYIIIASTKYENDIKMQIENMGFCEGRDFSTYSRIREQVIFGGQRNMNSEGISRKNIMYIFNDSAFGGAGQSLLDTLVEIRSEINPVVIIRDNVEVESKFREMGIRYYKIHFSTDYVKIGSANEVQRIHDIRQSYEAALQLLPIIQKENIQLIHINSSVSSFAAIAALIANVPYIWHIRELLQEHFYYEFLNEDLKISLYKKANKLIAISEYVKGRYYEKYGLETVRLYNGLNIKRFKRDISTKNKFENTFIVAAMITPEKGQWDVIRATELLVERGYDNIKVNIAGGGAVGYVWALKKYIKEKKLEKNIHILPFQDDLSHLRSQSAYAITSSQNEALGRVTIEAMLAGNLVIGARSGGTTEIIGSNEERGFLYELGNSKSLADTMERAINYAREEKEAIVQKAQKYAESTFDSKQYCKELLEIYDEVIASFGLQEYDEFLNTLKEYYYSIKNSTNSEIKDGVVPYKKSALLFPVVLKWLEIRQKGHSLDEYFKWNNIQTIGIYGMGALGCRLYDELENSIIQVKYLFDRNPNGMDKIFEFSSPDRERLDVDAIVVTVISAEQQIIDEIKNYGYENVIGLSTVLDSFDYI